MEDWHYTLEKIGITNPEEYFASSLDLLHKLQAFGIDFKGKRIVDIGCGSGRLPLALMYDGIQVEKYTGLEIEPKMVQFCAEYYTPASAHRYEFLWLDVINPRYNSRNHILPEKATFPLEQQCADIVVCNDVFTHIEGKVAILQYLNEIDRIGADHSDFYSTWYFSGNNIGSVRAVHPRDWVMMQINLRWDLKYAEPDDGREIIVAKKENPFWQVKAEIRYRNRGVEIQKDE